MFDSPLELDVAPYQNSEYSAGLADRVQKLTELLRIGDQVDQTCLAGEGDAWKCVFGEFFLKYQQYPSVILADLYDTRQLSAQLGYSYGSTFSWNSLNAGQKDYCNTYADETREYLDAFTFPNVQAVNGFKGSVFSPSCGTHKTTMDNYFFDLRTGESGDLAVTYASEVLNDAIQMVFAGSDSTFLFDNYDCSGKTCSDGVIIVEDTCEGYQCSFYCDPTYVKPLAGEEPLSQTDEESEPVRAVVEEGGVDWVPYIIIGAAAGGCLLVSTLVCMIIRCARKGGADAIEVDPQVSVEHHDTEMSNREAELNSASDFNDADRNVNE